MADNKSIQAMRMRSRASLEKSARNAGIRDVGHKNKLTLARDIDRARKDTRNQKSRNITAGRKLANRPEDKRHNLAGYWVLDKKTKKKVWIPYNNDVAHWNAYKLAGLSR